VPPQDPQPNRPHLTLLRADEPQPPAVEASSRQGQVRRVLWAVLALNLIVAAGKIAFGVLSGSLAIAADGFHSLLDGAGNIVALVGSAVAARPPDPNHAYGHQRYETLTSLGIAGLMLLAVFALVQEAWARLHSGHTAEVTAASFAVMGATLAVNVFVTVWERRSAKRLSSSLLAADAKHTSSDILASLAVIGSLVAVALGVARADAAISLVIAAAIAWGAWTIVRDASLMLTDATAAEPDIIANAVRTVAGVKGTHNIRSRAADGHVWVDLHIQVDPRMPVDEAHEIASQVAQRVENEFHDPTDVTVHIEPANERHLSEKRGYDPHLFGRNRRP
jgi:cation diffusion facilitator family transporter